MPNAHASDHRVFSIYIPRELYAGIRAAAERNNQTMTDFIEPVLYKATKHIQLTPEDYERIADDIRIAESKRTTSVRRAPRKIK